MNFNTKVLIIATPNEEKKLPDLESLRNINSHVKMIVENRRGYGRAYKSGLKYLKSKNPDLIITGDADGTYPLEFLPNLISQTNGKFNEFYNVGRLKNYSKGALSRRNLFGNRLLTWGTRILFLNRMNDSQSGMWLFKKDVLTKIDLDKLGNGMEFSVQIKLYTMRHKQLTYNELESTYYPRVGNTPQLRWFRDAVRVAWKTFLFRFKRIN